MKFRIRNQKDAAAGLFYVITGSAFSLGSLNYKLGDASRMGPGWFPFWVGLLLALVGLITLASGLRASSQEEKVKRLEFGALAWITAAVVAFGLLLQPLGLVAALFVLVMMSSMASHEFTWGATFLLAFLLILFSVGVFVWGISLQIPLWPSFIR